MTTLGKRLHVDYSASNSTGLFTDDTVQRLHVHCSGLLPRHEVPWVGRVILRGSLENKGPLSGDAKQRDSALLLFSRTELFRLVEFNLGDGLEMANFGDKGEETACFIVQVSQDTELFELVELYWEDAHENSHLFVILRKRLHVHCSGLPGQRALWVGRVVLRRWPWNGYSWVMFGKCCFVIVEVFQDTELFELVEAYSDDSHQMACIW